MTDPVVDVLIPVYKATPTIETAFLNNQQRTGCDIRIIVVDDGPPRCDLQGSWRGWRRRTPGMAVVMAARDRLKALLGDIR